MKRQTLGDFTDWFCANFYISKAHLKLKSQRKRICFKRHCFCAMASQQGFTQHEIAQQIGRSPSTVWTSIERHKELVINEEYQRMIGKKFRVSA